MTDSKSIEEILFTLLDEYGKALSDDAAPDYKAQATAQLNRLLEEAEERGFERGRKLYKGSSGGDSYGVGV